MQFRCKRLIPDRPSQRDGATTAAGSSELATPFLSFRNLSVPYFLFSFVVMAFTLQANKVHLYTTSIRIDINYP